MRTLGLGMCVIALLAVSALLDRESGVAIWVELREDLAVSTARVERLARENDAMRREIEMLETDPAAIDRAIREELDMVLPGESVVRFTPPQSDTAAAARADTAGRSAWRRIFASESDERERK